MNWPTAVTKKCGLIVQKMCTLNGQVQERFIYFDLQPGKPVGAFGVWRCLYFDHCSTIDDTYIVDTFVSIVSRFVSSDKG